MGFNARLKEVSLEWSKYKPNSARAQKPPSRQTPSIEEQTRKKKSRTKLWMKGTSLLKGRSEVVFGAAKNFFLRGSGAAIEFVWGSHLWTRS
jgi:hypothetical protein